MSTRRSTSSFTVSFKLNSQNTYKNTLISSGNVTELCKKVDLPFSKAAILMRVIANHALNTIHASIIAITFRFGFLPLRVLNLTSFIRNNIYTFHIVWLFFINDTFISSGNTNC